MKTLNLLTLALVILGGLNWALVGLFQFDLMAALFGGADSAIARLTYILIGGSAIWQLKPLSKAASSDEATLYAEERALQGRFGS